MDGVKFRYHHCPECGHRFKSIADDPTSKGLLPDPEKLKYLRPYNGKCGGVVVDQRLNDR